MYNRVLTDALFQNPTSEYRGTPFWAWNTRLTKELLSEQIGYLKDMGFGGFHMHPRTGLETPYLSEAFMTMVTHCVEEAKAKQMLAWLYDEDRWPSGFGGGLVTKEEAYRARYLLFTPKPYDEQEQYKMDGDSASRGSRTGKGKLIATYDIVLDTEGYLKSYERISSEEKVKGTKWYAYLEVAQPSPWFNNQTYVDALNPKAIQKFIEITYERYKEWIQDAFGKTTPAIFTDEPQFTHKTTLTFAHDQKDIIIPWTDDLIDTYEGQYEDQLLEKLPEIFWEVGVDQISITRYRYHDHIAERFAQSFADQCGKWCEENGLLLTGHMMEEPTLQSQTAALGEAMRSYRGFGLPGIDMLCDNREYNTAKQAQSAARQFGRPGVLSELYGVTNWDFDFRGHKLQGDWQAALGVTVRVPHLAWVSMEGESKRDYPASIGYQSPWYRQYPVIEDHFARLNTVLSQGRAVVKIGVIHPIESYWLRFGPLAQTGQLRADKEKRFKELTEWLLFNQLDFDFVSESLLPMQCEKGTHPLKVGQMKYEAIIVPECETLRQTTYERLLAFKENGGTLICLGKAPRYMDAKPSEVVKGLYKGCHTTVFDEKEVVSALEVQRDIKLVSVNGQMASGLIYQMREDDVYRWLFICQGKLPENPDGRECEEVIIQIPGVYQTMLYDTMTGDIQPIETRYEGENTYIPYTFYNHSSLLIRLEEGNKSVLRETQIEWDEVLYPVEVPGTVAFTLEEPNVYLLDRAAYRIDDGIYEQEEEILRLDNRCREKLGYLPRGGQVAQPWTLEKEVLLHTVTLKFSFESEVEMSDVILATENAAITRIWLNGVLIEKEIEGWFVDHAIQRIKLPQVIKGINVLEIRYPFGQKTQLEWCYLLGPFGVRLEDEKKILTVLPDKLAFGDIVSEGLPFYGGNLTYKISLETIQPEIRIHVPKYRGALINVRCDGREVGKIVFAPNQLIVSDVKPGRHELALTLFGNRVNTFGPVHNCNTQWKWFGPDAWRSEGESWSYGYCLKQVGILSSPVINEVEKKAR